MAPPKESTAPTVLLQRPPKLVSGRGSSGRAERGWQGDRGAGSNRPGRQFGASGLYQARPANQDVPRQVRSTATEDSSSGLVGFRETLAVAPCCPASLHHFQQCWGARVLVSNDSNCGAEWPPDSQKKHLKLVDSNWCFQGSPQRFSTVSLLPAADAFHCVLLEWRRLPPCPLHPLNPQT